MQVLAGADAEEDTVEILGGDLNTNYGSGDLLGGGDAGPAAPSVDLLGGALGGLDLLGGGGGGSAGFKKPVETWLSASQGQGLEIQGTFSRSGGHPVMEMTLRNS